MFLTRISPRQKREFGTLLNKRENCSAVCTRHGYRRMSVDHCRRVSVCRTFDTCGTFLSSTGANTAGWPNTSSSNGRVLIFGLSAEYLTGRTLGARASSDSKASRRKAYKRYDDPMTESRFTVLPTYRPS